GGRLATCATEQRFMGSLHDFDAAHWDHEPLTACPGFRRSDPVEPPKGGTPNQPWFMESLHEFLAAHRNQEPTRPGARFSPRRQAIQSMTSTSTTTRKQPRFMKSEAFLVRRGRTGRSLLLLALLGATVCAGEPE